MQANTHNHPAPAAPAQEASAARPVCIAQLTFGRHGNAGPYLFEGWSFPEPDFAWTEGPNSTLALCLPTGADQHSDLYLELRISPFIVPGRPTAQRLAIFVNDTEIARETITGGGSFAYPLPAHALNLRTPRRLQRLRIEHPDVQRPCDHGPADDSRELAFMFYAIRVLRCARLPPADITALPPLPHPPDRAALNAQVRQAVGMSPEMLSKNFESLGHNCEFGLVQRHFGAEQLGLLRFAGVALEDLVEGLARRFENLGDSITVIAVPNNTGGGEYFVNETAYNISFHTFISINDETPDRVRQSYIRYLSFQRRVFLERLEAGGCICIVHRRGTFSPAQARALLLLLRTFGPNSLLYIDESPLLPSGAVEQLDHGLYHGKLAAFAPLGDAGNSDLPGWASLCVNTYRLWRAGWGKERPGGSAPFSPPPHTDSSSRAPAT
jgi:hypothetical protein